MCKQRLLSLNKVSKHACLSVKIQGQKQKILNTYLFLIGID